MKNPFMEDYKKLQKIIEAVSHKIKNEQESFQKAFASFTAVQTKEISDAINTLEKYLAEKV